MNSNSKNLRQFDPDPDASSFQERTDLIAVTEHGREDVLQEGEDVLVGLEQTPHGLQLHHLRIWPLRDWGVTKESAARAASTQSALIEDNGRRLLLRISSTMKGSKRILSMLSSRQ